MTFTKLSTCTASTWPRFLGLVAMLLDRDMRTEYLPAQFKRTGKAPPIARPSPWNRGLSSQKTYPGQAGRPQSAEAYEHGLLFIASPAELEKKWKGSRVLPLAPAHPPPKKALVLSDPWLPCWIRGFTFRILKYFRTLGWCYSGLQSPAETQHLGHSGVLEAPRTRW